MLPAAWNSPQKEQHGCSWRTSSDASVIPKKITSDRGPQFVSNFMTAFYKMLNVHANPSTAYHPQTDGLTERANGEVIKYLHMWVNA